MNRIAGKYSINEKTGCWEWCLYRNALGYGTITVNKKNTYAHRYSYLIHNNNADISGKVTRHKCDNPCCVNPEHLIAGTQKENVNDILLRGRRNDPLGENNYASKFSNFSVEAMRVLHEFYSLPQYLCAKAFGMSRTNANQILNYKKRLSCSVTIKEKPILLNSIIKNKNSQSCQLN